MMQFQDSEMLDLIRACKVYQKETGSVYIFDRIEKLIGKLKNYREEHSTED
ncbi:hypothetical protein [Synechococcus phage S-B68]|nr:hypothetical protein [Synechococcus phage S-B68]